MTAIPGEARRWTALCAENEALNKAVKQYGKIILRGSFKSADENVVSAWRPEIAMALVMDKLRLQRVRSRQFFLMNSDRIYFPACQRRPRQRNESQC